MTWNDFHRRHRAIEAVLDHSPDTPLDSLLAGEFADAAELLSALQHKWTQQLTGRIGVALADAEDEPRGDRVQAVAAAWRRTAAANPALRARLDQHQDSPALAPALEREQRLLALASGLAEHGEPATDVTRTGSAFQRLLRSTPSEDTTRTRSPLAQLRKLIPSG